MITRTEDVFKEKFGVALCSDKCFEELGAKNYLKNLIIRIGSQVAIEKKIDY
jgi:hypothetical protein